MYLATNAGGPAAHGWGAAMSTDSAFALGTLAVTGPGSPTGCARSCCRSRSWMTWSRWW
ncbi:MAG TPA: Na+/H+ antiporter NhaA [Streptosporangiaceae bacterium]